MGALITQVFNHNKPMKKKAKEEEELISFSSYLDFRVYLCTFFFFFIRK